MRKYFSMLIPIIATVLCITPVYAQADSGAISLNVLYSSEIQPQEGDIFTLSYMKDGSEEGSIEVDAYAYAEEAFDVTLDPGSYTITDITYEGNNDEIEQAGYICNNSFLCKEDRYAEVNLAIGEEQGNAIADLYGENVIAKRGGQLIGDWYVTDPENENEIKGNGISDEISSSTDWEPESQPAEVVESDTTEAESDLPEPIYYDQEEQDTSNSSILGALPLMFVAVAAAAGVIYFKKHKKE